MQSLHQIILVSSWDALELTQYLINQSIIFWDLLGQIVHSHTYTKQLWKYIHKRPWTMVLLALYLASTTSLITVSTVKPSQLQKILQEQC